MFRAEVLWISVFLAIGAIGGLVYNWPATTAINAEPAKVSGPEADSESISKQSEISDSEPLDVGVRDNPQRVSGEQDDTGGVWGQLRPPAQQSQPIDFSVLQLGDHLLAGGNSIGAYQHYTKLWQRTSLPVDSSVLIRMGLASELAGLNQQAEKHYRSAIRVTEKGSVQQLASLLGTARIWEREAQLDEAIALLSEMFLLYSNDRSPEIVRHSIVRQLADCLQRRLLADEVVRESLEREPMQYHWCPLAVLPILELADLASSGEAQGNPLTGLKLLQDPRGDVSLILVAAHAEGISMLKLIADLETLTGMKFDVSERAKSSLVGRLANLDAPVISVSLLLDQVLEPMLLSWSQVGQTLTIVAREELTSRDSASYDLARVQRMLQQVQLSFPNGVERSAAIMNDGNNSRLTGGLDIAADKYRAARETNPTHELNAKLFYNEASLELMQGDRLDALHASYMALDQTLSASMQAEIYAMIAELEIEFGQLGKAITAASRGLRRAEDPKVLNRTVMALARAYLLSDDPYSANSVLFEASEGLAGQPMERLATVFSTYARFQHVRPKHGLQDEGQRLVMALAAFHPKDVQSFSDALIISQAYSAVGLRSKATENLNLALEVAPQGYWNERIRLQLAETYLQSKDFAKAQATIESFGDVSGERLPSVLFLQASVALEMGELERCDEVCRRILSMDVDTAFKSKTLEKLGQALQRSGDHYAAALCFAGLLPRPAEPRTGEIGGGTMSQ